MRKIAVVAFITVLLALLGIFACFTLNVAYNQYNSDIVSTFEYCE